MFSDSTGRNNELLKLLKEVKKGFNPYLLLVSSDVKQIKIEYGKKDSIKKKHFKQNYA